MKKFKDILSNVQGLHETAGAMGKDQKYSQPAEYDPDHKATKHYEKHVMNHIAKHEKSGKYKVNHSFGNGEHQGKKHANPDITMHYSGDAEGNYDAHSYTVHHKGAAANDKKLHAKPMHNFKESVDEVIEGINDRKMTGLGKTHETESGTAKITKTHVHFDNSGYKQKFSHKEIAHMDKGGTVRGFKHEKDNPYHDRDNHVYSNGDEEHHLPTKHKVPVKESLDEVIDYAEIRKHLKKTGKGGTVSYKHNDGSKKTGTYGGLMNRGGRSYAKVHHTGSGGGMAIVPLPNIHHK